MKITVDCYAGYRGEETPRRFRMGERRIEIAAVEDRWLGPDHRYFKVKGDDNAIYILRHDPVAWHWEITFYQAPDYRKPSAHAVRSYRNRTKRTDRNSDTCH